MAGKQELNALKDAYAAWGTVQERAIPKWRALMAEDFKLGSVDKQAPGLDFAAHCNCADEAIGYLSGIFKDWKMRHYTPEHYVCQGDLIAMFGRCGYTHKTTGKDAECRIACLWRFEDGKAVAMTEIFDSAAAAAAAV